MSTKKSHNTTTAKEAEVTSSELSVAPAAPIALWGGKTIKRVVTIKRRKLEDGRTYMFTPLATFAVGMTKARSDDKGAVKRGEDQWQKPLDVLRVKLHESEDDVGEIVDIIANSVLKSQMEETYPDAGYVGLSFMVRLYKQPVGESGRQVKGVDLVEVA